MRISILGTGWLGTALFKSLVSQNKHIILGCSRNPEKRQALIDFSAKYSLSHAMFDITVPTITPENLSFFDTDILVITIPPGRRRTDVATQYPIEIEKVLSVAASSDIKHIIYTSSTGVYGAQEGAVDEQSPIQAVTASANAVASVEAMLVKSSIPTTILRLAGLYGPDRHPGRWFSNKAVLPDADAPVNLVHQSDVVQAIEAVIKNERLTSSTIYNVCAMAHPSKGDFYPRAIKDYGGTCPKLQSGGAKGKYIISTKIRSTLGWSPTFDQLNTF